MFISEFPGDSNDNQIELKLVLTTALSFPLILGIESGSPSAARPERASRPDSSQPVSSP
jgi:hypothetical protein